MIWKILFFHLDDVSKQIIPFDKLDALYNALKTKKCIVHCFMGVSRSASFVIAYLMKYYNMRLDDAYLFVKKKKTMYKSKCWFQRTTNSFG
jgi:protein-tyrosine phosphatase